MKIYRNMILMLAGLFVCGTMAMGQADDKSDDGKGGKKSHPQKAEKDDPAKAEKKKEAKNDAEKDDPAKAEKKKDPSLTAEKDNAAKGEKKSDSQRDADGENREKKREEYVDRREDNQRKRIDHGIAKGYLTPDEIKKLEDQQKRIAAMEADFKSDGKLNKDEMKDLREALNTASRCIWAEKHDTEGRQMAVYRLGKNVFAKDDLTSKLQNESLPAAEAKALVHDFHEAVRLKHKLATHDLSAEERAKAQAQYNELLNKYFELREDTTPSK
ncbi:MAG: hypothetical protein HZA50_15085 [Planctomycetes bacterium]|nr:hypothetical protein [Planctomycetota bacterium]